MAVAEQRPRGSRLASSAPMFLVGGAGLALTLLYAFATSRMLLTDSFPGPGVSMSWIEIFGPSRRAPVVAYLVLTIPALLLYAVALAGVWRWRERVPRAVVVGFPVLFAAALLWMYPPTASDIFHYHADARTLWIFHRNPLLVPPSQVGYFIGISWADLPSPYGPAWSLLTWFVSPLMIFGDHAVATLIGFKALAAATYLASTWVIYRLVAATRPGSEMLAVALFAWNPFVVIRVVANGHNDLAMVLFALLALLFAQRRDWTLVFPLLAMSVLVKFSTALLGPPVLLYAWAHAEGSPKERARALAPGVAIAAGVTALVYAPFWAGTETFSTITQQAQGMITSTPEFLTWYLGDRFQLTNAEDVARWGTALAFLALTAAFSWQARRDLDHLLVACAGILFCYLVIAAGWYRPWYMLWPAALLALRPTGWSVALFLAITTTNMFPDLVEHFRYDWGVTTQMQARLAPLVTQFLLPSVLWIAGALLLRSITLDARDGARDTRAREATAAAQASSGGDGEPG